MKKRCRYILEFCEKCGSMMRPSKESKDKILICSLCNNVVKVSEEIKDSYTFHKEIDHQEQIRI
jgi:DNA-directed RNA polymerase subunit M/transcription elongation factor TFIIS